MTERQVQLVDAEILRHISLASISNEPVIKRSHMEVADALKAALASQDERRSDECKAFKSAQHIASFLRHLLASVPGRCQARKRSPGR